MIVAQIEAGSGQGGGRDEGVLTAIKLTVTGSFLFIPVH
jgi:hypothetical protein